MKQDFAFNRFSERRITLQKELLSLLENEAKEKLIKELKNIEAQEKIKIAFVGQHNSGKSTIISALTGNKSIKISANVETDIPADYVWNDVLLTDTPGLFAGVKEEHDILSLQKIKESDLLVFCITSSLFDNLLIDDFVDLAYNRSYKSKIFLLINKMSQEDGEFSELINNYTATLSATLKKEGGNLTDFPFTFVDAHDYIDGIEEHDEELLEFSNFNQFIILLNDYIKDKGLASRLDTPCRLMIDAIDTEISNTSTEFDKNFMAVLRQAEECVRKHETSTNLRIKDMEEEIRSAIMNESKALISKIGVEKVGENECEEVNRRIESVTEKKVAELQEFLINAVSNMNEDIADVLSSEMANFVFAQINSGKINLNAKVKSDLTKFTSNCNLVLENLGKASSKAIKMAGEGANFTRISTLSGSQLHNVVLQVGHFFGKTFKPWEAIRVAANIGKVAKILGPVLAGIPILIDIFGKFKSEHDSKKVHDARRETFNQFSSVAADIVSEIDGQYREMSKQVFTARINEIASIRNGIIKENKENNHYVDSLKNIRQNIYSLITDIVQETA